MPHQIFLLRHGETEWNRAGRIQGQRDSALTNLGRQQALRQSHTLQRLRKDLGQHRVVCSPLLRAQTTAQLALGSTDFVTDPRVSEIACGRWENTTHSERLISDPDLAPTLSEDFDLYIHAPDGEGLVALEQRLLAFLADVSGPTVIFSHKIALVVMRAILTGQDDLSSSMAPPQGSIMEIKDQAVRFHV